MTRLLERFDNQSQDWLNTTVTRVDRESGSKEALVEDLEEDSRENLDKIEVSANVSNDKDETFKAAETSLTSDKGDADDTVGQNEEIPKLTRKETKATPVLSATIGIEILDVSDGDEDEYDDICVRY
jgi:hypothetical protein